jgi:hypothetical protein
VVESEAETRTKRIDTRLRLLDGRCWPLGSSPTRASTQCREDNFCASAREQLVAAVERRMKAMGRRFKEPHRNDHFDADSELPAQWETVPLGYILEEIKYRARD